jgi:hypothetical protein
VTLPLTVKHRPGRRNVVLNHYPRDATVYATYQGMLAGHDQESLILTSSTDGKTFTWLAVGVPETPAPIPRDACALRFEIKPGARLYGFDLIAVPNRADLPKK